MAIARTTAIASKTAPIAAAAISRGLLLLLIRP